MQAILASDMGELFLPDLLERDHWPTPKSLLGLDRFERVPNRISRHEVFDPVLTMRTEFVDVDGDRGHVGVAKSIAEPVAKSIGEPVARSRGGEFQGGKVRSEGGDGQTMTTGRYIYSPERSSLEMLELIKTRVGRGNKVRWPINPCVRVEDRASARPLAPGPLAVPGSGIVGLPPITSRHHTRRHQALL